MAAGPFVDRLVALFTDREDARAVGRAFLATHPAEADRARLLAALAGLEQIQTPTGLRQAFAGFRERDFQAGDIVIVDGWVLARCEARLCALVALS